MNKKIMILIIISFFALNTFSECFEINENNCKIACDTKQEITNYYETYSDNNIVSYELNAKLIFRLELNELHEIQTKQIDLFTEGVFITKQGQTINAFKVLPYPMTFHKNEYPNIINFVKPLTQQQWIIIINQTTLKVNEYIVSYNNLHQISINDLCQISETQQPFSGDA